MTTAVTYLSILRGFRVPDGIIPLYPVYFCDNRFTPSKLLQLDEWLLSERFKSAMYTMFLKDGGSCENNPILTPTLAPAGLLKRMPRTILVACEIDVLRDHALTMLDKMIDHCGNKVKLIYLRDTIHGFCSFSGQVNEYKMKVHQMVQEFRVLLRDVPQNE